ncbi:MAG: superoxide dismutase [Candidatus Delongbacteria bacterium]
MFTLPDLRYDFSALEPYIDGRTMEIHHGKHHAAYVANLNAALEAAGSGAAGQSLEELLGKLGQIPEAQRTAVRNNGGGHWNHSLFWNLMCAGGNDGISADLATALERDLGGPAAFREAFAKAATTRFGSGWAWLVVDQGKLKVLSTPNQDNPLMDASGTPILALDVWEHAYYLKYQNRRPEYIENWWKVVDWSEVSRLYRSALA